MKAKPMPERGELASLLENCSIKQVREHYNVHPPTLYAWMRKYGIPKKTDTNKQPNA